MTTIGGNQPNPASNMPTGPTTSSDTQHSADVDPNKLLLMLPDLDKRARDLSKLARTVDQSQDKVVSDSQQKSLIDFAKSLISQPDLPAGTKAALDKWVADVTAQDATTTPDSPDGTTTQTQDAATGTQTGQTATGTTQTGTTQTGTTQTGTTQTGTQAGTPTGTPQTGTQAGTQTGTTQTSQTTTQTQTTVVFGGDPSALLTDDPSVSSDPVKTLGKMASTIATAQGGKLTEEQITLLTKEASDLFTATPSKLTDADKAVLLSFIGQLEEFPVSDDSKTPGSTKTSQPTTNDGSQTAQTRSAKGPDTSNLEMDELGLGDAVRELGQQAMSYVQGNGGKLGEKEAEQLKMAAEELIAGGADGDDLKALQNFLKALVSFPKTASGPADSPLLLTQPGINPEMVKLAQYANAMMKAQNGTLTQPEVEMLKNMAEELMSQLSPEDQAVMKTWLATLGGVKTTTPPQVHVFTDAMMFGATPKTNPFMSPGIMSMLAPILSEILALNNDIIKQSSKLKQSMMKLLVAMANEAFKFAIDAGQAKAAQLEKEAMMHMTLGISGALQAGMSMVTFGVQQKQQSGFKNDAKQGQIDGKLKAWSKGDLDPPTGTKTQRNAEISKRQEMLKDVRNAKGPDGKELSPEEQVSVLHNWKEVPDSKWSGQKVPDKEVFTKQSTSEKYEGIQTAAQRMQASGSMLASNLVGQFGGAIDHAVQAGFTAAKIQDVLHEASANAYKEMISQLISLVTGTIQTASEEMDKAQRNFESFAQLYKDFANTITQGIYQNR